MKQLSEAELERLKAVHGKLTAITVPMDDEEDGEKAIFYLKRADKTTRKMISKLANGSIPEKAIIAGYKALTVGGDDVAVLEDEDNYDALLSAQDALIEHLTVRQAEIKKN
jgi:basic membrane lipoprotein Med (substrate-binding protein (PBP1-ABC) superfamily)